MKPLVAVFAHPDDEAFGPAGTLAKFAKERDVYILCVTRGDTDARFTKHETNTLGDRRIDELKESGKILGIKGVTCLNFQDGTLSNNLYHKVADSIQSFIDKVKPDTLMTFEPKGVSGHLDHISVSFITTFVFYRANYIKHLMYFGVDKSHVDAVKKIRGDYFVYFPPGFARREFNQIIDVTEFWEVKLRAMRAHASQAEDANRTIKVLSAHPKEECFFLINK